MRLQINLVLTFVLLTISSSYGQMESYEYKRELIGIQDQWHKIVIPKTMFGTLSRKLTDIRIYGITKNNDTIEAPYILQKLKDHTSVKNSEFKIINTSHTDTGYFYTFEVSSVNPVNQMDLDFGQQNYDWQLQLEGSNNQQEWFTIIDDYRIVSIKNELTDFTFDKLSFPSSKYNYYRLQVNSKTDPDLQKVSIQQQNIVEGSLQDYAIKYQNSLENKQTKQTEISIELEHAVPVSFLKITPHAAFDYYRPVSIQYVSDSTLVGLKWKFHFNTLTTGVLNSNGNNEFKAVSTTTKKLKVHIHNQDNQPLDINSIQVKGYTHEIITRITEPATYYLAYGYKNASQPRYDIAKFKGSIPSEMKTIKLGDEIVIEKAEATNTSPLFENKIWLWGIMGVLILILGGFSFKMIKQK